MHRHFTTEQGEMMKKQLFLLLLASAAGSQAVELMTPPGEKCDLSVKCGAEEIENVHFKTSSPTGTPGHLMYSNFIGSLVIERPTSGRAGSGTRLDLCNGPCEPA
jgi:hypothetical protein